MFGQIHLTTVYIEESNEQLSCCHQGGTENVISVSSSCQDKSCHGLVDGHKGSCTQACHRAPCHPQPPPQPHTTPHHPQPPPPYTTRPVVVATTLTPFLPCLTPCWPPLPVFPARHADTSACDPLCLLSCSTTPLLPFSAYPACLTRLPLSPVRFYRLSSRNVTTSFACFPVWHSDCFPNVYTSSYQNSMGLYI